MSEADTRRPVPRKLSELKDVFDFLEEVRLRPGMWMRSLDQLESMLVGYRVALEIHGVAEEFDFWPQGPFAEWLWRKLGRRSPPGWAAEIDREAAAADVHPTAKFFSFLDEYLAGKDRSGPVRVGRWPGRQSSRMRLSGADAAGLYGYDLRLLKVLIGTDAATRPSI